MHSNIHRTAAWVLLLCAVSIVPAAALTFRGGKPRINNARFTLDQEVVVTETVSVNHRGGATSYFLTFSAGASGDFSNRTLTKADGAVMYYNIYDGEGSRNILKDLSAQPSASQVITDSFTAAEGGAGGGTTHELSFAVILDPDQFPLAGQYDDSVTISMYEGTPENTGRLVETLTMDISAQMDAVLELSIVPEGGQFDTVSTSRTLDFGVMYPGNTKKSDLLVRANNTYSVSVRSEYAGVMAIQSANDGSVVPYRFYADGALIDLSSGTDVSLVSSAGPTDETGDRYALRVEIGDYGMATEGNYADTITITVAAP